MASERGASQAVGLAKTTHYPPQEEEQEENEHPRGKWNGAGVGSKGPRSWEAGAFGRSGSQSCSAKESGPAFHSLPFTASFAKVSLEVQIQVQAVLTSKFLKDLQ